MENLLGSMIEKFNMEAQRHMERQRLNPFSGSFSRSPSPRLSTDYGKPIAGSKTEERGKKAKCHILREIMDLCNCIYDVSHHNEKIRCQEEDEPYDPNHDIIVTFKEIFQIYTNINDKVVGLLIAAKKRGFIYFEKEILFQRQDDDVLIALIKPISEIREIIKRELNSEMSPARTPVDQGATSPEPSKEDLSNDKDTSTNSKEPNVSPKTEENICATSLLENDFSTDGKSPESMAKTESRVTVTITESDKKIENPPVEITNHTNQPTFELNGNAFEEKIEVNEGTLNQTAPSNIAQENAALERLQDETMSDIPQELSKISDTEGTEVKVLNTFHPSEDVSRDAEPSLLSTEGSQITPCQEVPVLLPVQIELTHNLEGLEVDDDLSIDLSSTSDNCDQEVQRILESNLN